MSRLIHPTARRLPVPSRAIGRALLVTGLAVTFALVLAGAAPAGTVRVSQCNAVDAGGLTPRGYQADLRTVINGEPTVSFGAGGGRFPLDTPHPPLLNRWVRGTRF